MLQRWFKALVSVDDVMITVLRECGYRILGVIFPIVLIICCFCFCYCIRRRTANNNIDWSCDARTFPNNDFCCLEANPVWSSYGRDDTVRTVETIPRVRRVNTVITTTFNQPSSIHPSIIYPSIPCTLPYSNPPCIPGAPPSSSHPSIPDAPPKYTEVCQTAEKPPLDAQL